MALTIKLTTSASFRSIQKIIAILNLYFNLAAKAPTHTTVLTWAKKYGYYQLHRPCKAGGDWVLILDESIQFGQNQLLVIYGVRPDQLSFTRPLCFPDVRPLVVASQASWTGQDIYEQLRGIRLKLDSVCYAVADEGNALKKALRLAGIAHVQDLTHQLALILKQLYQHDADFLGFTAHMAHMRGSLCLSNVAHILPPAQRSKARFMNLQPICEWGARVLELLGETDPARHTGERQALAWVAAYRPLITELAQLHQGLQQVQSILKSQGICPATIQACRRYLPLGANPRLDRFSSQLMGYLQHVQATLGQQRPILCSSDIIESCFGKYKNYMQGNPMVGITDLALCAAAFTGKLEQREIQQALERTTFQDLQRWSGDHIAETTLAARRRVLKNRGKKNS